MKHFTNRLLLLVFLLLSTTSFLFSQDSMKVHIIDVGQGSATLIEFECGVILFDVGGEENYQEDYSSKKAMYLYLTDFFKDRPHLNNTINLLAVSHPHSDHDKFTEDLITKNDFIIKNAITNGIEYNLKTGSPRQNQQELHQYISLTESPDSKIDKINYYEGRISKIPSGGITNDVIDPLNELDCDPKVTLLWGRVNKNLGWSKKDYRNDNNHSVSLRIDYGESSLLLTGDLEDAGIHSIVETHTNNPEVFDVDLYIVGHHGAANGTTKEFLEVMTPEYAILSFGPYYRNGNRTAQQHGHPREKVINLLRDHVSESRYKQKYVKIYSKTERKFVNQPVKKAIYATGWDGDMVFEGTKVGKWSNSVDEFNKANDLKNLLTLDKYWNTLNKRNYNVTPFKNKNYSTSEMVESLDDADSIQGVGPATLTRLRAKLRKLNTDDEDPIED